MIPTFIGQDVPPRMLPFYVSAEFYYHNIHFDRSETVGFNCNTGACDYFQFVTYPVATEERGPGLKFGLLLFQDGEETSLFILTLIADSRIEISTTLARRDPRERVLSSSGMFRAGRYFRLMSKSLNGRDLLWACAFVTALSD